MSPELGFSRRRFLQTTGAVTGGLVLGFYLPDRSLGRAAAATPQPFAPNAFVRIATDDTITVLVNKSEMGQGVYTSLPMLIAEELDADWSRIQVQSAPAEPVYYDPGFGVYLTGGSSSTASSWQRLRTAGATTRALLVNAAAQTWSVDASSLRTESGHVIHPASGRRASYGSLAERAAALPIPEDVQLKDPKNFTLIGTDVKRIEGPEKVTGQAVFAIDLKLPGMLTAVVAHAPVCGGRVRSFNADKALSGAGVVKVKQISSGIAVIARDFWTAKKAREELEIEWDDGEGAELSTAAMRQQYLKLAEEPGAIAEDSGDAGTALEVAAKTIEAVYEVPYLTHACMEPLSATAHVREDGCDIWAGTQYQSNDQLVAAKILGSKPELVRIHTTLLGGGFGRRATPTSDFVADAVEVARGEKVPVKTIWTREDDIRCGYYRPMFVHKLAAGLDGDDMPVAWHQRLVGQSIGVNTMFHSENGIDNMSVEGATQMPYAIPNRRVELHSPRQPVTVLWWRSVGHSHTGFVSESFLDELAHAGAKDPFELRRTLLANEPRYLGVLELAAERAGWGTPLPEGRARGIATHKMHGTYVAQVAEVSVEAGQVRVHRVVCAVDCGIVMNPWNVRSQMEGGIVFGLTAALHSELTVDKGRIQQSNFHDYPVLRMDEMPKIDVYMVPSREQPTGVGELAVPAIAPAVANALFALTRKRIRKLPIRLEEAVDV